MLPRRTILEWITVAHVSGDVQHLFVEGPTDANLMRHLSGYQDQIDVRTASEIDCETDDGDSFSGGHKLRLMKLANAAATSSPVPPNLICFADADFGCLVSSTRYCSKLVLTDYANLPATIFDESWLRGHFQKAYGYTLKSGQWSTIFRALRDAFIVRFLLYQETRPRVAPSVVPHITVNAEKISYNRMGFVSSFSSRSTDISNILKKIDEFDLILPNDVRYTCNSNDMFELLYRLLRQTRKISGSYPEDALRKAFFGSFPDKIDHGSRLRMVLLWATDKIPINTDGASTEA